MSQAFLDKPIKDFTDEEAMKMVNMEIAEANKHKLRKCRWTGCKNKVIVDMLGQGYFCRYHKLLGEDFWYERYAERQANGELSEKEVQRLIEDECNKLGKEACDKIVIEGAKDSINWVL